MNLKTVDQDRPAAIIYTHSMLEGSMTFIKSQAEALVGYRSVYVGAHRVDGIPLPAERTFIINDGPVFGPFREAAFRKFGWAPRLAKNLKRLGPRVVHSHFGTCGPAGMSIANMLSVPLVVTFHGHDATMTDGELRKSLRGRELLSNRKELIERTGKFIAVSDYIRTRLIEQGYPEGKVIVHRNGINLEDFKPDPDVKRLPIIVFVGRFVEKKGGKYLIEAASELVKRGVKFKLIMIGGGPLESELRAQAAVANIPCEFTGFIPVEEVRGWLAKATVAAIPSVTASTGDTEGLPTILLEAQAMETPVVATRHSGIPEGIRPGVTGELIAEKDHIALAAELRGFLESPTKSRQFGIAARQFVSENFDMRTQVLGLENIYDELFTQYAAEKNWSA
jgi:glycosyltransferase involved in cell wall biosynthesis